MGKNVVIGPCRFSYLTIWEARAINPGDTPKYSVSCLIPKSDKKLVKKVQDLVNQAAQDGVAAGKFKAGAVTGVNFKKCLHDGDQAVEEGLRGEEYKGHYFFNCNNAKRPGIVGPDNKPILDEDEFYSGCWGYVDVSFFPFNNKSNGVGCGLNNIMKLKDGDRLDNRRSAEEAFGDLAEELAQSDEQFAGDDGELQ